MKKVLHLFLVLVIALAYTSCEGPEGPAGAPGPAGPQGPVGAPGTPAQTAQVYEFGAEFEPDKDDNYSIYIEFQNENNDIDVAESDVVLVYILQGAYGTQEAPTFLWSPLPQMRVLSQGTLQYNFLHSLAELLIYIETPIKMASLTAEIRDPLVKNQGFRMIVLPGELMDGRTSGPPVDLKNYEQVMKFYNLTEKDVIKLQK